MTTPEFVLNVIRQQDYRYWTIKDALGRLIIAQMMPKSNEEAVSEMRDFMENNSGYYRIDLYKVPEPKKRGSGDRDDSVAFFEITLSPKKQEAPVAQAPVQGMGSTENQRGFGSGVSLEQYLSAKEEASNLRIQVHQLQLELQMVKENNTREIERLHQDYTRQLKEKENSGKMIETALGSLQSIIMPGAGNLSGGLNGLGDSPSPQEAVKQKIVNACNRLMKHDKNFPQHLELLANLAEKSPMIYSMAISKLKSM